MDTIGQNDRTHIDRFATPHSDKIHVVERYRLSEDGQTIETLVTTEDYIAFTVPWSGRARYARQENTWREYVCAENNEREFWPGHKLPTAFDNTPDF